MALIKHTFLNFHAKITNYLHPQYDSSDGLAYFIFEYKAKFNPYREQEFFYFLLNFF